MQDWFNIPGNGWCIIRYNI